MTDLEVCGKLLEMSEAGNLEAFKKLCEVAEAGNNTALSVLCKCAEVESSNTYKKLCEFANTGNQDAQYLVGYTYLEKAKKRPNGFSQQFVQNRGIEYICLAAKQGQKKAISAISNIKTDYIKKIKGHIILIFLFPVLILAISRLVNIEWLMWLKILINAWLIAAFAQSLIGIIIGLMAIKTFFISATLLNYGHSAAMKVSVPLTLLCYIRVFLGFAIIIAFIISMIFGILVLTPLLRDSWYYHFLASPADYMATIISQIFN